MSKSAISTSTTLFISMLLVSCFEADSRLDHLFSLQVQVTDLPPGWYLDKTAVGAGRYDKPNEGIISRAIAFRRFRSNERREVAVAQELVDYPDPDQAASAYSAIVKEETPTENWIWPKQIQIQSQADQFSLACLDLRSTLVDAKDRYRETHWCRAISRYGTMISIIYANVFEEDQWLTFEDLGYLLKTADARLADGQP